MCPLEKSQVFLLFVCSIYSFIITLHVFVCVFACKCADMRNYKSLSYLLLLFFVDLLLLLFLLSRYEYYAITVTLPVQSVNQELS